MKKKIKKKTDASYNKIHMEKKKSIFTKKPKNKLMGKTLKKNYTELHLRDHLGMHINPFHVKERWNYGSKPNYVFALNMKLSERLQ